MFFIYRNLLIILLCFSFNYALADITGIVLKVVDGDTVHVMDEGNKRYKVRLLGIDAPELDQSYGIESKDMLADLIMDKRVSIIYTKKDKYKRVLGQIFLDEMDVNLAMIRSGLAWHFKRYSRDQAKKDVPIYSRAEQLARENAIGLWSDSPFLPPWKWRQNKRRNSR